MRLITHTDLDGVVCALLISKVEDISFIKFTDPESIEKRTIYIDKNDIIADLPYHPKCGMWFDHHKSNQPKENMKFKGRFEIEKSAARVVYRYYDNPYLEKYAKIVDETDRIDSGDLTKQDILEPKGLALLSLTLESENEKKIDDEYRRKIVDMLGLYSIEEILEDKEVKKRIEYALEKRREFFEWCKQNIRLEENEKIAICDARGKKIPKAFSNFIIYLVNDNIKVSIKILDNEKKPDTVKLSVGKNIFNEKIDLDIGSLMKKYGGGGHENVGGCVIEKTELEKKLEEIKERIKEKIY